MMGDNVHLSHRAECLNDKLEIYRMKKQLIPQELRDIIGDRCLSAPEEEGQRELWKIAYPGYENAN